MARQLRIEYPDAHYHIINRGNRRERVFVQNSDYELFLDTLAEYADQFNVVIHSYCLMPNHYHIQLQTRDANLSRFMQSFSTFFTMAMNRRKGTCGHLFQGRFKAQLIESELYKNTLSRYIHLNPVKTKSTEDLPLGERKKLLKQFRWSSYAAYIGLREKPFWLDRRYVLSSWGRGFQTSMKSYRKYVEDGLRGDNAEELDQATLYGIIGSDSFIEKVRRQHLIHRDGDFDGREQPDLKRINAVPFEEVLGAVMAHYGIEERKNILVRKGADRQVRDMAIYLSAKHSRGILTLSALAERFNLKISGYSTAKDRVAERVKENSEWRTAVGKIERNLLRKRKTEV